ncbi:MAG: hypothetical protein K9G48_08320 [Reyranella sp.]|nr:hypothetical protein [Reyranella sp.]
MLIIAAPRPAYPVELLYSIAAQERMTTGRLALVDVRSAEERRLNGVPAGALWVEWAGDTPADHAAFVAKIRELGLGPDDPVALICAVGHRSGRAGRLLEKSGYRQISDIGEGFSGSVLGPGWRAWGLPLAGPP